MVYTSLKIQHEWDVISRAVCLTYDVLKDTQNVYDSFVEDTRRENITYLRGAQRWLSAKQKEDAQLDAIVLPLKGDSFTGFRTRYFIGMHPKLLEQWVAGLMHPRSVPFSFSSRVHHERFEMEMVVREHSYCLAVEGSGRYERRAEELLQIVRNYFHERPLRMAKDEEKYGVMVDFRKRK